MAVGEAKRIVLWSFWTLNLVRHRVGCKLFRALVKQRPILDHALQLLLPPAPLSLSVGGCRVCCYELGDCRQLVKGESIDQWGSDCVMRSVRGEMRVLCMPYDLTLSASLNMFAK